MPGENPENTFCLHQVNDLFSYLVAPEITEHPQNTTATEGLNVTFSCNAIGNPVPTFSWTINGSAVNTTADPRIGLSQDNKQLTITNVKRTDSGNQYRCVANNTIGILISNAATLNIQCKYYLALFLFDVHAKVAWCSVLSRGVLSFPSIGILL